MKLTIELCLLLTTLTQIYIRHREFDIINKCWQLDETNHRVISTTHHTYTDIHKTQRIRHHKQVLAAR